MTVASQGSAAISAAALSKLRWRCRRGMLENDLLIERFLNRSATVTQAESNGLYALMELADNELLDLFLGRKKPTDHLDRPEVHQVLEAVRMPRATPAPASPPVHFSRTSP